jgi:hypothetical protein
MDVWSGVSPESAAKTIIKGIIKQGVLVEK